MTSTNMARLNDMIRVSCPGALDGTIRMEMFNVLKEFFQRTNAWILEIPVYIVPTSNDYRIDTGQNVVVNRLMGVGRLPSPLPPGGAWPPSYAPTCPPQYLSVSTDNTASSESQNPMFRNPRAGALLNAGTKHPILRISENPGESEMWLATLALVPCDPTDSEGFTNPPDWVMEKYLSYIRSGAVCQLMLQAGKPYSSVPGSQYHGRKFNEGVGLARTEVRHMFGFAMQHWLYPSGWNARFRFTGAFS